MRRSSVAVVLLILLVVLDVVLVTGAVRSTHVDTAKLARQEGNQADAATDEPTAADSSGTASPTGTPQPATGKVVVTALSGSRAWRAVTPSMTCRRGADPATIGHTQDRGKTWTRVTVPMTTVSGLSFDGRRMIATGLDGSCRPVVYALSSSAGPSKVQTAASWAVDPQHLTTLLTGGKPVEKQPCTTGVADIAANSPSDVVVLCGDGSVRSSTDTAKSWKTVGGPSQVVAIATGSSIDTIYTATRAGCGIAVRPLPGNHQGSCVPGTKKWTGPLDVTVVGGTLWLATADAAVTQPVADLG